MRFASGLYMGRLGVAISVEGDQRSPGEQSPGTATEREEGSRVASPININ